MQGDGQAWRDYATTTLQERGFRNGAARQRVIEALATRACCVTAQEIADELRAADQRVGVASVYRALEVLDRVGLVRRLEVGDGTARYEPARGEAHHHHVVCSECGAVAQFADEPLEAAISALSARLEFAIDEHEVVLRGLCPACADAVSGAGSPPPRPR